MNIVPPVVGVTPGPEWADDINSILETQVAPHTHTGSPDGSQLTQAALNINGTLTLNNNILSAAKSVAFATQVSEPVAVQQLYSLGGNLWWTPAAGSAVQLTAGSTINISGFGGISGLPNGTAAASYDPTGFFSWKKSTNNYAGMKAGKLYVFNEATSAPVFSSVIQQTNTLAANNTINLGTANLTLPSSLPAATGSLLISPSGVITASAPNAVNVNIANSVWTTGGAQVVLTSYVPTGRRVLFTITNTDGSTGYIRCANTSAFSNTFVEGQLTLDIAGTIISTLKYREIFSYATTALVYIQPALTFVWTPTNAQVGNSVTIELTGTDISNLAARTMNFQDMRLQITDL